MGSFNDGNKSVSPRLNEVNHDKRKPFHRVLRVKEDEPSHQLGGLG